MRRADREIFERYNEIAKEALSSDDESADLERLTQVLDWQIEKSAEKQQTPKETQVEVFQLQARKQEIMQGLKERLRCLDDPEREPLSEQEARGVRMENGAILVRDENGKEHHAEAADLLHDGEWGIRYALDESVPRDLRKHYLVARARQQIQELLDEQLLESYAERKLGDPSRHSLREAYRRTREAHQESSKKEPLGLAAERMARTLLSRYQHRGDLPFRVEFADIYEDIEHKMDYIISRTDHRRGVGVVEGNHPEAIAVQFSQAASHRGQKQKQLRRMRSLIGGEIEGIDDYVLLIISNTSWVKNALREWDNTGKPPGGPEQFIPQNIQEQLFKKPLRKMYEDHEIDAMWEQVNGGAAEAEPLPKAA